MTREEAKEILTHNWTRVDNPNYSELELDEAFFMAIEALQTDDEQGWRIGKPKEQGEYIVTLDSFGHKRIDLFYYGKPMIPNRKVRGKCWYRTDILAWQPLPTPYGERADKCE